jgi:pimeloyl-ACP methyl ester carboxylesterase
VPPLPRAALERIPLPWFIKRQFLNAFLRDVHHYLFDVEYAPPGGKPVHIQKTIRQRFVEAICAPAISRPHIVVSHSMGTVIAYDCLKRVAGCSQIDGFITIGSPLGLDEVQDKLQPGWTRNDGFPSERLAGKWSNLFDRLDPVCGLDPLLANDYRSAGASRVEDGSWRHSATKYLRQPRFCGELRSMLEL